MLLENGGADKNWHNPYYVSCLQVVDNVVSVSVMESTCVEVCYISESDPNTDGSDTVRILLTNQCMYILIPRSLFCMGIGSSYS